MPTLYAIDSMAVLYRGYFAMIRNPLINSRGLNTSGIRTVLMQMVKIIEEDRPDYLAVASDSVEPTFRHERFPEYKATREKMPEDLVEQLPYLPRLVEALKLPYLILPGYEADDIIGTLMRWCREAEIHGVMVTSDKDYLQLVSETTEILNHNGERLGLQAVQDRFGGTPEQVIEVLGLMGDSSDNIPGVRGVGEKTAVKLIQDYGSIAAVYEHLEEVRGKLQEKLRDGRDSAELSRELVTIHTDVPLSATLEDLHLGQTDLYDNPEFHALLEELEFNTLLRRFSKKNGITRPAKAPEAEPAASKSAASAASPGQPQTMASSVVPETERSALQAEVVLLETPKAFRKFVKALPGTVPLCLAFTFSETHQRELRLSGMALCAEEGRAGVVQNPQGREWWSELADVLAAPVEKVVHDLKRTWQGVHASGMELQGVVSDVMLAAHLVDPLERKFDLDRLIGRQLGKRRNGRQETEGPQLSMLPDETLERGTRLAEDAVALRELHQVLSVQLERTGQQGLYRNIEMPLALTLARMEWEGVSLDTDGLREISREFDGRLDALRRRIHELAGSEFNVNSVPELQAVLYEQLRLHEQFKVKPRKIKIGLGLSTDEETLEKLAEHELPRTLLEYRGLNKLKNTYIDQLPTYVHPESSRIHSTFNQAATATGRLSSENPNLQNIPVRTAEGRRIRQAFVPSGTDRVLISADYSQIELRVVAHYSKDPTFLAAYRDGLDIHALTASAIFEVPEDQVSREMRSAAKEVNFGLIYRMGADRLALVTGRSKVEAKAFIERYFQRYSTIHALQEYFLERARKEGYAQTLLGRRRPLPDINGRGLAKALAEGGAVNTPIQGSAAEIIKLAMLAIERRLQSEQLRSRMVLSVHDEIVLDAYRDEVEVLQRLVREEMEQVLLLEVPLVAEVGVGDNWLEAH
jgi:DNA polymerase-1